jgi:serine protease Do
VLDVQKDSPASLAGLKPRDVIIEYNGKPIESSNQLFAMVQRTNIGDEVPLKVWRAGEIVTLKVTIAENKMASAMQSVLEAAQPQEPMDIIRNFGILVRSFTVLEKSRGLNGVLVTEVDPRGFAASQIQVNDIIIAVNQNTVQNAQDFYKQFVASAAVQATQITLVRGNVSLTVTLQSLPPKPKK